MAAGATADRRELLQAASALALWLAMPLVALRRAMAEDRTDAAVDSTPQVGSLALVDTTEPVSSDLMQVMCAHCAAYSELGRVSKRTDAVVLGHAPALTDLERLGEVSQTERDLFLRLCRYPASNDAERQEKAVYLLAFCDGDEFEREHVEALLVSMGAGDSQLTPPWAQSS
ncbi:hypothetical protein [Aminobacter ciceronei]|uniref:Uncharacterized protein n=1 Tax=Aminobacter ciceronei TaxID=150723 RepID=A0ABR6CHH0_9HYPH|nr:hypothetical protein [Aminobacter ciceronei]MBA8910694.1 hypothetical protein [Aminobacter ciceronei]MBA9024468.1 hypothetical protein [Aminobacter ciceronei]